ncbi:MAG: hypothetical protein MZW92_59790 [Comamonadaceae bacterium]|nr:hypothetical protein [Comamonadaceae bacterium]
MPHETLNAWPDAVTDGLLAGTLCPTWAPACWRCATARARRPTRWRWPRC